MNRDEFLSELKARNIDTDKVSFDDNTKDGYCVRKIYFRWEVVFRERGHEFECMGFPTESDALIYLSQKLFRNYSLQEQ